MITPGLMASARWYAETLMTSTCTVREAGSEPVTDEETGEVTYPVGTTVYSGKCRVRPTGSPGTETAGGEETFTFDYKVSIPFTEANVLEGFQVTIDSSPDPALVGVVIKVEKVDRGEHITARRLFCSEVA